MTNNHNHEAHRLRPIPTNTVVHTPTEAEVKELLAILHENGYTYCDGESLLDNDWLIDLYDKYNELECLGIEPSAKIAKHIEHCHIGWFRKQGYTILTLAEFKERYCEEEKPQQKFKVGDKVRVVTNDYGLKDAVGGVCEIIEVMPHGYYIKSQTGEWFAKESDLEPYTEPEIKPTEDMETQELNLCELLKGLEGQSFYHLMYGVVEYKGVNNDGFIAFTDSKIPTIYDDGKYDQHANVVLYPSRALYERYPLDAAQAWSVWQEEQKKPFICIHWGEVDCNGDIKEEDYTGNTYLRTPADRDKCIEEIKAIIEKYQK